MPHTVIKVQRDNVAKINDVTSDEIVSRLSITSRDSEILGVGGDCVYVLFEGQDEGLARAQELFEKAESGAAVAAELADQVRDAIKAEEDSAAEGMGSLFG